MLEPIAMELGMYIMPPESISTAHFTHPFINNTNITASEAVVKKP
jgi:hypothetical protein